MLNKRFSSVKRVRYIFLVSILLCFVALSAYAALTTTRYSNIGAVSKEADGLLPGGDRQNSYAWSMESMENSAGDEYLYVGSTRDILYLMLQGGGLTPEAAINIFGDDIPVPATSGDLAAKIFRKKTNGVGDWETVYTSPMFPGNIAPYDIGYRGVKSYAAYDEDKPSLYFGTMGLAMTRLLKFGPDFQPGNEPKTVYQTAGPLNSIRAVSVYDYGDGEKLYIGVMLPSDTPGIGDMLILESEKPESNADWTPIASFKNGDLPGARVDIKTQGYGGVWDLVGFNGYLYAFVGSYYSGAGDDGFMVFKGRRASDGEGDNGYGWIWEPVVCTEKIGSGAKYPNGVGNKHNVTASPFVYSVGGKQYMYVATMADVFAALASLGSGGAATDALDPLYPCQVYRFDKDDKWEMIIGNPEDSNGQFSTKLGNFGAGFFNPPVIGSGVDLGGVSLKELSMNQYAWRLGVYNNKLYVSTLDIGTALDYAENFTEDPNQKLLIKTLISTLRTYNTNPPGFDLYSTSDGKSFSAITTDGFGDKFNYGGRTLRTESAGDALFVGTANPFYGCQVWKITDEDPPNPSGGGGGGCNAGFAVLALLGMIPIVLFRKK